VHTTQRPCSNISKKRAVPSFEIFKAVNSSRRFINLKGSWSTLFVDLEPLKTMATFYLETLFVDLEPLKTKATFYLEQSGTSTQRHITEDRNTSTIVTCGVRTSKNEYMDNDKSYAKLYETARWHSTVY
jgi:hypothetical protein